MTEVTRRAGMGLIAGAAALAATGPAEAAATLFLHGVASGDPAPDSVVLWTRVTTAEPSLPVVWEVARDPAFRSLVRSGTVVARRGRDHTVKVVADGLAPGVRYHYRFRVAEQTSVAGRTRTLPIGQVDRLGIALMSCASRSLGYFNTYGAAAKDPAVDFVLHTGDYIYEYGDDLLKQSDRFLQSADPPHETVSLDDYRRRHASHKADLQLQAMHAAHPLIALWDDHEVANDSWIGGAENHQAASEGAWAARRDAAIQAYYEWMPVRDPAPGGDPLEAWRTYRFGDLATMCTLETRLTARGQPVDYKAWKDRLRTVPERATFLRDVLGDRNREMMSERGKAALKAGLEASVADKQPWRIIGNGALLGRNFVPNLRRSGVRPEDHPELAFLDQYTDILWLAENDLPDTTGAWDGYAGARQAFYELCQAAGAKDLLVLSGDSHAFWCNRLADDAGVPMGIELGTAGVTMPSSFAMARFKPELIRTLDGLYTRHNPEVQWTDGAHCGYVRVVLRPDAATADFIGVDTSRPAADATVTLRTDRVVRRNGGLALAAPV